MAELAGRLSRRWPRHWRWPSPSAASRSAGPGAAPGAGPGEGPRWSPAALAALGDRTGARWRRIQATGWTWAPVLLLAAAGLQLGARPWLQDQAEAAAAARADAEARARAPVASPAATADADAAAWWSSLPSPDVAPADLETVVGLAQALGLPVQRAQLRRIDAPAPLRIEEIELDLDAPYAPTRRFLARALNGLPHASVRRLRLERDAEPAGDAAPVRAGTVRTSVTLRLHYRATEAR